MAIAAGNNITGTEVSRLFQSLRAGKKTGTAVFEYLQGQMTDKAVKKAYFKGGEIIFASSNLSEDWLGRWLVRTGKLTRQQCDASEELVKKTGKKQGAILVDLGFLTPHDLVDGVKLQVKQIILSLFSIRNGSCRFDEGPLPAADIIPLRMSVGNLILEGLRQFDWQAARKSLPPLSSVLRPSSDPSTLFQRADLTADETAVFSLIDGKRSIEEICSRSGIGDFNTLKGIFLLLSLQVAELGESKTEKEMRFVREAISAEGRKQDAAPTEERVSKQMMLKAFDEMPRQTHYQVLGVANNALPHEIKKAYFKFAKLYHPDRHFDPEMQDMKEKLEALFHRIHEAYETLSDPSRRNEYDRPQAEPAKKQEFDEKHPEDYVENYQEKAKRALEQFNTGMKEYKIGNFWGAVDSFSWAARLDPVKAQYFYYLGLTLTRIPRRRHEAEENLQKAIEIDPLKADYYVELGSLYAKSGLKSRALEVFNLGLQQSMNSEKIKQAIQTLEGTPAAKEDKTTDESKGGVFKKIFGKEK